MAVEWIGLGVAILKVALRLHEEPDLADVVDDSAGAVRRLNRSFRKQRDLGTTIANSLRQEVLGQRGHNPPTDPEQEAAVGIAAQVVAGLAEQQDALVSALAHPNLFHQFVLEHGGLAARAELVAERAEPLYDRILAAACQQIVALVPTSSRALSAGVAELLRHQQVPSASLGEDLADTRTDVAELLDLARREKRPARDRVQSVSAALPPYLGEEIIELLDRVPQWADLAEALVDADTPTRMLQRFAADPAPWLESAPGKAWVLLGHALASYDAHEAAADAYQRAVRNGVSDSDQIDALGAMALQRVLENGMSSEPLNARIAGLLTQNSCVLAHLLMAVREGNLQAAYELAVGLPQSTPRAREQRAALIANTLIACGRYPEAEVVLRDHLPSAESASLYLILSSRLRDDAAHHRSTNRSAALLEAVDLALTARQRRRGWNGDAVPPILGAVEAAWELGDHRLVRQLVTPVPDGDATERESKDSRLLVVRAMVAADGGDDDLALLLAQTLDEFARLRVQAVCVTRRNVADLNSKEVTAAWRAAWDAATTDAERITAAQVLLPHGGTAPGIDDLRRRYPEAMAEIDAMTDALLPRRGESSKTRLHRLRKSARTNRHAGIELGFLLAHDGKTRAAADAWSAVADQFDDQKWRLQAAALLLQAGDRPSAVVTAENALSRSLPDWPGRRRAHAIAIEAAADDQDWRDVVSHARQLLTLDDSAEVRWVLAHAMCEIDESAAAWTVVDRGDSVLEPVAGQNHRWQTSRRLELVGQFGSRERLLECAIEALRDYRDDEEASAQVLGRVYTSEAHRPTEDTTPATSTSTLVDEFAALTGQFLARFPDSTHFRAMQFDADHPEQFLEALTEQLAPRAVALHEVEAKVRDGQFPVGALATMTDRPYAEIHLIRASQAGTHLRRVDAATNGHEDNELTIAFAAEEPAALIDASALHTLTWLSDQTRSECLSALEVQITRDAFNDLRRARNALASPGSGPMYYDVHAERLVASEFDEQRAKALTGVAAELVALAQTLPRVRGIDDAALQLRGDVRPWLGLVSTCRARGVALWSDDVVLRDIARAEQVPTFGTYSLLARLHTDGALSPASFEASLFDLTQHRGLDLPFQLERLRLVAGVDRWRPDAAALVLTRPGAWTTNPSACLNLLAEACAQRSTSPPDLAVWAARAAEGLCASIPDIAHATPAIAAMLARLLITPSVTPEGARAVLDGIRAATTRSSVPDPWAAAVNIFRDALLNVHSGEECRLIMTVLAANLEQTDQQVAFRSILEVL